MSSLKDVPQRWIELAFSDSDEGLRVCDRFRSGIDFMLQDIRQQQPCGPFDLICCRHLVFTYFDERLQEEVLDQLTSRLRDEGVLVIGNQEELPLIDTKLRLVQPHSGIYRWHSLERKAGS